MVGVSETGSHSSSDIRYVGEEKNNKPFTGEGGVSPTPPRWNPPLSCGRFDIECTTNIASIALNSWGRRRIMVNFCDISHFLGLYWDFKIYNISKTKNCKIDFSFISKQTSSLKTKKSKTSYFWGRGGRSADSYLGQLDRAIIWS